MADSVLITLIVVAGGLLAVVGWKVLDIGKRAMELDRGRGGEGGR
jgi:hypothetical protein